MNLTDLQKGKCSRWLTKQNLNICCVKRYLKQTDSERLKIKRWIKTYQGNGNRRTVRVMVLKLDKVEFKSDMVWILYVLQKLMC
jgi:hypothetical protein